MASRRWRVAAALALVAGGAMACSGGSSGAAGAGSSGVSPSAAPTPSATAQGIAVVDRIAVDGQPCGIASAAGSVWVSDARGARLLRIDPRTGAVEQAATLDPT